MWKNDEEGKGGGSMQIIPNRIQCWFVGHNWYYRVTFDTLTNPMKKKKEYMECYRCKLKKKANQKNMFDTGGSISVGEWG